MDESELIHEELTRSILGAFFEVYNGLGDVYLEHLYVAAMELELTGRGLRVARELGVRVYYKGHEIGFQRLDMVVEDLVVIEAKSTVELHKNATRQLFNYSARPVSKWDCSYTSVASRISIGSCVRIGSRSGRSTIHSIRFIRPIRINLRLSGRSSHTTEWPARDR